MAASEAMPFEQRLLKIPESFMYRVPPLRHTSGHRAEDWGLAEPMMTARLELIGINQSLEIRIFDASAVDSAPAAVCPVRFAKGSPPVEAIVDPVVDSSRYFVLRCEDHEGRHAYVGVGFRERDVAYDFKATIYDFGKSVGRELLATEAAKKREEGCCGEAEAVEEAQTDLTLKAPIKISLGPSASRRRPSETASGEETRNSNPQNNYTKGKSALVAPPPLLKPPPRAVSHEPPREPPGCDHRPGGGGEQDNDQDDGDEFGDFESA